MQYSLKYIAAFLAYVILCSAGVASAQILSPFSSKKVAELDSVIETNKLVILIELNYQLLMSHRADALYYVAHLYDKTSGQWTTVGDVNSAMYLDGGSREIHFEAGSDEFKFYLPAKWKTESEGEKAFGELNGQSEKVLRYGASMIGYKNVLSLILPLYQAADQEIISRTGNVIETGIGPKDLEKSRLTKIREKFFGVRESNEPLTTVDGIPNHFSVRVSCERVLISL